jgi:hypothetical protein
MDNLRCYFLVENHETMRLQQHHHINKYCQNFGQFGSIFPPQI